MAGPLTIACPTCGEVFALPAEVVDVDTKANRVVLNVDRSAVYGHLTACAAKAAQVPGKALAAVVKTVPDSELAGRIHLMLDNRAYLVKGASRACTMCGANSADCMALLTKADPRDTHERAACCAACGVGNTHPAPGADRGCAEWATEHGAQN